MSVGGTLRDRRRRSCCGWTCARRTSASAGACGCVPGHGGGAPPGARQPAAARGAVLRAPRGRESKRLGSDSAPYCVRRSRLRVSMGAMAESRSSPPTSRSWRSTRIANAANTQLTHGGGVAAAIATAGGAGGAGRVLRARADRLGEAVETTAGAMPARWVIHAATMELGGPTPSRRSSSVRRARRWPRPRSSGALAGAGGLRDRRGGFLSTRPPRSWSAPPAATPAGLERSCSPCTARRRSEPSARPVSPSRSSVAPDSFKGTFSAHEVAAAIAEGLRGAGREARSCPSPTAARARWRCSSALSAARSAPPRPPTRSAGRWRRRRAALRRLGRRRDGAGQRARARRRGERDAWAASTRGTGELIAAAAEAGASSIVVTVGGSATTVTAAPAHWRH